MLSLIIFLLGFFFFPTSSKRNTFYYVAVCMPFALLFPFYYKQFKLKSWLTISALVFAFYLSLNSLWSIHYSTAQSLKYLRYLITLYCLFAAVFLLHYKKPDSSRLLFKAFLVVGFFHSLYGIFEHFSVYEFPLRKRFDDSINSAMLVGLLLLTSLWLMFEKTSWKHKIIYFALSIPFIIILLLSKSRGPQISLLLVLPFGAFFLGYDFKKTLFFLLITVFIFYLVFLFSDAFKMIFSRGLSFPAREEIWATSFNEALDYFWFGQGASPGKQSPLYVPSGRIFSHSHNIFLSIFRKGGIIAVLLFFTTLILCFLSGFKNTSHTNRLWLIWLMFGTLCLLSNCSYPLARPSPIWLAFWIPMAFICAKNQNFLPINYNGSKRKSSNNLDEHLTE